MRLDKVRPVFGNKGVLAGGLLLAAGVVFLSFPEAAVARQHALFIGISQYEEVAQLTYSVNDMKKMKAFYLNELGGKPGSVIELADKEATRDNILKAFATLGDRVRNGDRVMVYYSGHGAQVKDDNGDESDGDDEVLVSFDATLLLDNVVLDDEIDVALSAMEKKGAQVVMITDACHSGSITRNIAGTKVISASSKDLVMVSDPAFAERREETPFLSPGKNRVEWSAAAAGQLAYEHTRWGGGVFTRFFLDGISGKTKKADQNKDGAVSNSELLSYVRDQSEKFCEMAKKCRESEYNLTPVLTIAENRLGESVFPELSASTVTSSSDRREQMLNTLEQTLPLSPSKVISVSINEGDKLKIDDELFIKVKSKKSGYLLLLDLKANGDLVQLFPNEFYEDNRISAGKEYYVPEGGLAPYAVVADEVGKSHIFAIVTHDKIDLSDITGKQKDLTPVNQPEYYASKISSRLNEVWREDNFDRVGDYSVARFDYVVK